MVGGAVAHPTTNSEPCVELHAGIYAGAVG